MHHNHIYNCTINIPRIAYDIDYYLLFIIIVRLQVQRMCIFVDSDIRNRNRPPKNKTHAWILLFVFKTKCTFRLFVVVVAWFIFVLFLHTVHSRTHSFMNMRMSKKKA